MRLAPWLAVLSALVGAACCGAEAQAQTLTVTGASAKVCQLTGQNDWYSGQPTNAQTQANYGLTGVDLGFPVESDTGQLLFLFGDTVPNGHPNIPPPPTVPPDDAVGYTTRTTAPDSATCLGMKMFSPGAQQLTHPTVTPVIQQGSFNVPTGGIDWMGQLYEFFWTNHCVIPDAFGPNPTAPLALPPSGGVFCLETPLNNSLGLAVMAQASPSNPTQFTMVSPQAIMPNGFVYVSATMPRPQVRPIRRGEGRRAPPPLVPVFGVARYRASIPYLALAPRGSFSDVASWWFYGGTNAQGPIWLTYAQWQGGQMNGQWAPPAGAELWANSPNPGSPTGDERCVGEHSVTWNAALGVYLMMYGCGELQVEARTALYPWGPWSKPTIVLSAIQDPGLFCTLFWNKPNNGGCPANLTSQQPPALTFGFFYAPYVMTRFTKAVPAIAPAKAAQVYWLLSTWDPYQVMVMKTTLTLTP
jgi:hypothetical protein